MKKRYTSTSDCFRDIYANKEFFYSKLRDLRLDFCDLFAYEAMERQRNGHQSVVFTLTYNDEHLHTWYGLNSLDSDDLHKRISKASAFAKRLRRQYGLQFDYVAVGEYGNGGHSHDFVGKRGVGQNPHYHCVGWFSPVPDTKPKFKIPTYERLCLLLREAWQGCEEENPHIYGRSKEMRSLGLGYVRLQGPIACATKGCNYIAKYMGKDMLQLHSLAFDGVAPVQFHKIAVDSILEYFNYCDISRNDAENIFCKIYQWLPCNHPLYGKLPSCREAVKIDKTIVRLLPTIYENILVLYDDFMMDFNSEFNRISPKLRHFNGFGMDILNHANLETGMYQRPLSPKCRALPPSAIRKAYYDYSVSLIPNPSSMCKEKDTRLVFEWWYNASRDTVQHLVREPKRYKKQVTYVLNELGQKHFYKVKTSAILRDQMKIHSRGWNNSDYDKANIMLKLFRHAHLTEQYKTALFDLINDPVVNVSSYVNLALSAVNLSAPAWFRVENTSMTFDVDIILKHDYPCIWEKMDQIDKWLIELRDKKDLDDKLFCESWSKIYKSTL